MDITDPRFIKEGTLRASFHAVPETGCGNFTFALIERFIDPKGEDNRAELTTTFVRFGITSFTIEGKNLLVSGNFGSQELAGAVVLVNGDEKNTKVVIANSAITLNAKKGAKKIKPGQTFTVQVRFANGMLTPEVTFTAPPE
jgi:hypothetical protein